ncbi:MAG: hypothetical protein IKE12_02540 [Erysipelotrichaceae bacterium]|nr:hypothetical protein [Erysipelotrichaceae bacterium]
MLKEYRNELICDFAEEYHIYDIYQLPAQLAATLAVGLRANSRVKTKVAGLDVPVEFILLAGISDKLSIISWHITGEQSSTPQLILPSLFNKEEPNSILAVQTGEDFDAAWRNRTRRK